VSSPDSTNQTWCAGWLNNETFSPDNTNTALIVNSQLGKYAGSSYRIYHCPADASKSEGQKGIPRVRSYAMNCYVGQPLFPATPGFKTFKKIADMTSLGTANAFVFIDERAESINDGSFLVEMDGFDPAKPSPGNYLLGNYPGNTHAEKGVLGFADGHAEAHRWRDARTKPAPLPGGTLPLDVPSANNEDVAWIQTRTSLHE
jgi:hypothetical protein